MKKFHSQFKFSKTQSGSCCPVFEAFVVILRVFRDSIHAVSYRFSHSFVEVESSCLVRHR